RRIGTEPAHRRHTSTRFSTIRSRWGGGRVHLDRVHRRTCPLRPRSLLQVQEHAGERLRVLDLRHDLCELVDVNTEMLELLVGTRRRPAGQKTLRHEQIHAFPAEAWCRVEARRVAPGAAGEPRLLGKLALRALERRLPLLYPARGQLEELRSRRL